MIPFKCFLGVKCLKSIHNPRHLSSIAKTFKEDGFIQQIKVSIWFLKISLKVLFCRKIYEEKEMVDLRGKFDKLEASKASKRLIPQEINLHFTHKWLLSVSIIQFYPHHFLLDSYLTLWPIPELWVLSVSSWGLMTLSSWPPQCSPNTPQRRWPRTMAETLLAGIRTSGIGGWRALRGGRSGSSTCGWRWMRRMRAMGRCNSWEDLTLGDTSSISSLTRRAMSSMRIRTWSFLKNFENKSSRPSYVLERQVFTMVMTQSIIYIFMLHVQHPIPRYVGPWLQGKSWQKKDGDDGAVHGDQHQDEPHGVQAEQGLLWGLQKAGSCAWTGQIWNDEIL